MNINKQKLIEALTQIKPGLANSEIIEQSTHFCFDGRSAWTYNDQIAVSCPIKTPLKGTVSANEFFRLLEKFPDEELEVSIEETQIIVKGEKTTAGVNIVSEINLPKATPPRKAEWETLPEDFSEAISFAAFSASRNLIRPELACLSLSKNTIISCDGFRATKRKMKRRIQKKFLLPASAATVLAKYKPAEHLVLDNWIHFRNDEKTIFSCRSIAEDYPEDKINSLFKVEGDKLQLPKNFQEIIDRIQVMATAEFDQDRIVVLELSKGKVVCRGEGQHGWIEEKVRVRYQGKKIRIEAHPNFLIEILKHLNEAIIGKTSLLFKGENFEHVIAIV